MINHQEFWWRFFPKKELTQVYISTALRSLAISLTGVFIPLYLMIELKYTLTETFLFYLFYSISLAIASPVAAKFAERYGIKHAVLISIPFYLAFLSGLYILPIIKIPLLILGVLVGISLALYWMGMHLVFYHCSQEKHRGDEVGKREALSIASTIFGPLIGGTIIYFFGFGMIFLISSLLLLGSATFLFVSKDSYIHYRFSVRSIIDRKYWRNSLYFVAKGMQVMAEGVLWPLLVYFILKDYFKLGIMGSVLSGLGAVLFWQMGKLSDKVGKRKIVRWVSPLELISWIFRSLISSGSQILGATLLGALAYGIREPSLHALEYDKAKGQAASYFVSREIFICLGRILVLLIVLALGSLNAGMVLTGVASLAALLF
ncbi:MFS transporter [Candidatus Woesearchaeota archaeon]|nr:MFS transporter [Candidatus Woesearchaeota archaeon]